MFVHTSMGIRARNLRRKSPKRWHKDFNIKKLLKLKPLDPLKPHLHLQSQRKRSSSSDLQCSCLSDPSKAVRSPYRINKYALDFIYVGMMNAPLVSNVFLHVPPLSSLHSFYMQDKPNASPPEGDTLPAIWLQPYAALFLNPH